jgi:hypothetical protein
MPYEVAKLEREGIAFFRDAYSFLGVAKSTKYRE